MRFRSFVNQSLLTLTAALALAAMLSVLTYAADPSSATWTKLSPSTSPTPRTFAAMAYDPVSKKMVLFGGLAQTYLNDTWTFDGTKWTHEKTPVGPSPRTGSSMAFDKRTKKLVMFGGFNGKPTHAGFLQDTWLWDGATSTWTQAKMKSSPPRATGAMLFTDPVNGEAVMFGGYFRFNPVPVYSTTWRWSGKAWQKLHPTTVPIPRAWGIAVSDPVRKNVVLTGGNGDTIRTDNTWTWDGSNWTQQSPATQIPAMVSAGAAFDTDSQLVIVFGGWDQSIGQTTNQTWSWTGTNWVQLTPARSPSAREGSGMDFDPKHHEVVMFGGEVTDGGQLFNDTWKWTGR
jgi:hypothetical protein